MEKAKKKTIEQSGVCKEKTVRWKGGVYGGKDLKKRYLLSLEWKKVMDNESGDDGTDELREFG